MDFAANEDQQQQQLIEHVLSFRIVLSDRIRQAVDESKFYKLECTEAGKLVDRLSRLLQTFARFTNTAPSFYDRLVHCVFADVTRTLKRALILDRARLISNEPGVLIIGQSFHKSPIRVQIAIMKLIARMAEIKPGSQMGGFQD
ncbi:hypothetical protein L1887_07515 [Cichorium endivia]|nr:hypothetical protein L1887_07515 [Cichorium endivia]